MDRPRIDGPRITALGPEPCPVAATEMELTGAASS